MEDYIETPDDYAMINQEIPHKTEYSVFVHLFFGAIILGFLGIFSLIFKDIIKNVLFHFPIFSYSFLFCMGWGFLYYVYKIIQFRNFVTTQDKLLALKAGFLDKKIDLFNLVQIVIACIGIVTLINTVFGMIDASRNIPVFGHYDMVLYPLYIILICLVGISVLIILSLRINEIIYDLYLDNPVILNNPIEQTLQSNKGSLMSDTILANTPVISEKNSDTHPQNGTFETINLPNYDNGFLYKKLFELNDNVQDIQRHILIGHNDNLNNNAIETLWNTKIYPFLNGICERIKAIETKLNITSVENSQISVDKIAVPALEITDVPVENNTISETISDAISEPKATTITPTHIDDDFIQLNNSVNNLNTKPMPQISQTLGKISNNGINQVNTITEKTEPFVTSQIDSAMDIKKLSDDEEAFAHSDTTPLSDTKIDSAEINIADDVTQNKPTENLSEAHISIKDKTLEELSKFLEEKMKELYDNNVSKGRFVKTEAV